MRLFNWNGQTGSENTAVDSLGEDAPRPAKDFESCETVSIAGRRAVSPRSMPGATRHLLATPK